MFPYARPSAAPAQLSMRVEETCKVTCSVKLSKEDAAEFKSRIDDEYRVNMCGPPRAGPPPTASRPRARPS